MNENNQFNFLIIEIECIYIHRCSCVSITDAFDAVFDHYV